MLFCRELVNLSTQDESQILVYKAVLDGKLDVAVKTLKMARGGPQLHPLIVSAGLLCSCQQSFLLSGI